MQFASSHLGSALAGVSLIVLALLTNSGQQDSKKDAASPPIPPVVSTATIPFDVLAPGQLFAEAISAVVVKSWNEGGASAWSELNAEWPMYGSVPIVIDTQTLGGVSSFTYSQLADTGADVVILSNPAGGSVQFSPEEIEAIRHYTLEGHRIIGTYLTFHHQEVNNTDLASIFGLRSDIVYGGFALSNDFQILGDTSLFRGLGRANGWLSLGFPSSQTMRSFLRWNSIELAGAKLVAQCDNYIGMVSIFKTPCYTAVYFSSMPEYFGGHEDKQILYNAITGT